MSISGIAAYNELVNLFLINMAPDIPSVREDIPPPDYSQSPGRYWIVEHCVVAGDYVDCTLGTSYVHKTIGLNLSP